MKTIVRFCMVGCFLFFGFGYVCAQSAASSSKETVAPTTNTTIDGANQDQSQVQTEPQYEPPIPLYIDQYVNNRQFTQALSELEKYKASIDKKERNKALSVEVMFYQRMSELDQANSVQHRVKRDQAIRQLLEEFPKWSETYQCAITPDFSPEKVIEYCTKSLELDPNNYRVYERRANAYYDMGEVDKACADYEKLSYKEQIWQYKMNCQKESRP